MTDSTTTTNPTGGADGRHRDTQPALHDDLMAAVLASENVRRAWKRVKANKGAPGSDGMAIEDFPDYAREHWPTIRQALHEGSYQPQPVRRVMIPKPSGGERALGIPTVVDRVIQQAAGSGLGCGLAMSRNLAGVNPVLVTGSHGPGIEPCRHGGNGVLDA